MCMIKLSNIIKKYNAGKKNEVLALNNVSLEINKGDFLAVTGSSGAGKSTLFHIVGCIDGFDNGQYKLMGNDIKNYNDKKLSKLRNTFFGYVLQDFALIEYCTVFENLRVPLMLSSNKIKEKDATLKALNKVGMDNYLYSKVSELSGGQKQKVAIARAIINNPEIILADEPTGALDSENSKMIMDLFENLNNEGITVAIITHDPKVWARCKKVITISDGKI